MDKLTKDQRKQLFDALLSAFQDADDLAHMVSFGMDVRLNNIVAVSNMPNMIFNLIQWAEAAGRLDELITAARLAQPGNTKLRTFAEGVKLAPVSPPQGQLERIVLKNVQFKNVEQWRRRLGECELPVCRVEIPTSTGVGTGFLLGPSVVMTNYHVIASIVATPTQRGTVGIRFDYKTTDDGVTIKEGEVYRLAEDWLVDSSPVAELDYALLRIDGTPGTDPIGDAPPGSAPLRQWLTPQAHTFEEGEPLFIMQHPLAAPLKLAPGAVRGIDKVNASPPRVTYTANTEPGSSGSPCFSSDWELIALHHYGDPTGNEGIPFSAIMAQPKVKAALGT
jgi:hypothetical protein